MGASRWSLPRSAAGVLALPYFRAWRPGARLCWYECGLLESVRPVGVRILMRAGSRATYLIVDNRWFAEPWGASAAHECRKHGWQECRRATITDLSQLSTRDSRRFSGHGLGAS